MVTELGFDPESLELARVAAEENQALHLDLATFELCVLGRTALPL